MDAVLTPNDFLTGQVVVSHSGGGSELDTKTGIRKLKTSQLQDHNTVAAVLRNLEHKVPFLMILGKLDHLVTTQYLLNFLGIRCPAGQVKLKAQYNVLDWFIVTHAWEEPDTNSSFSRWKFRFEKLDLYKPSWWVPKAYGDVAAMDLHPSTQVPTPPEVEMFNCKACGRSTPVVFDGGYFCKFGQCDQFYKVFFFHSNRHPMLIKL